MSAPLIGITTNGRNAQDRFHLPTAYVEAVRRAGGIAVLVPPGEARREWLDAVDAVVLTGGGDLDPATYGEPRHATVDGVDAERDRDELAIARHVVAAELPALCICRGLQVLNVALGGSLIQHLPEAVGTSVAHRSEPTGHCAHAIAVEPRSRIAELLGGTETAPMSWHHQAIGRLARGLAVVARAADGTIEAVALDGHARLLAVQWHPEITAAADPAQQRLFDAVVGDARDRRRSRCAP